MGDRNKRRANLEYACGFSNSRKFTLQLEEWYWVVSQFDKFDDVLLLTDRSALRELTVSAKARLLASATTFVLLGEFFIGKFIASFLYNLSTIRTQILSTSSKALYSLPNISSPSMSIFASWFASVNPIYAPSSGEIPWTFSSSSPWKEHLGLQLTLNRYVPQNWPSLELVLDCKDGVLKPKAYDSTRNQLGYTFSAQVCWFCQISTSSTKSCGKLPPKLPFLSSIGMETLSLLLFTLSAFFPSTPYSYFLSIPC